MSRLARSHLHTALLLFCCFYCSCIPIEARDKIPLATLTRPVSAEKVDPGLIWSSSVVHTEYGPVEGFTLYGVNHYLGIPYAAAPVQELRFSSPQPATPWTEVRSAYLHGSFCPQVIEDLVSMGDEDCLFVNIYSPETVTPSSKLPVMVWIYGGAFVFGDGYEFGLYSGTNLVVAHNYIVVTFNYRVGAFGFMALDTLSRTDPSLNSTGNAGILDQLAALKWVQNNIAAFGGDPTQVTIAGESAGAMSVGIHMASPLSRGLFSAAIMESGTCDSSTFAVSARDSIGWSVVYAQSIGCNYNDSQQLVDCLRALPASAFLQADNVTSSPTHSDSQSAHIESHCSQSAASAAKRPFLRAHAPLRAADEDTETVSCSTPIVSVFDLHRLPNTLHTVRQLFSHDLLLSSPSVTPPPLPLLYPDITWAPVIDGTVLTDTPLAMIQTGNWSRVPLVIGSNKDEGTIFINQLYSILPKLHDPLIEADLPLILNHVFNDSSIVSLILKSYPVNQYPSINNLTEILLRDYFFACPSRRIATALNEQSIPVWLYQFDYIGDFIEDRSLGVYHSSELEFVFDNEWPPLIHSFSAQDTRVADTFGSYWSNMIQKHDPNLGEKVVLPWPAWHNSTQQSLHIAAQMNTDTFLLKGICDMWDVVTRESRKQQQSDRQEEHVTPIVLLQAS